MLTTIHDSEMTTHQLSDNIWMNVLKDEYFGAEDRQFPEQYLFGTNESNAASNGAAGKVNEDFKSNNPGQYQVSFGEKEDQPGQTIHNLNDGN